MIARFFARWEQQLASVDTNRVVRPFEWGLDWLGLDGHTPGSDPRQTLAAWTREVMADTDQFYAASPTDSYEQRDDMLRFPSAITTGFPENDLVAVKIYAARPRAGQSRRAVIVLPQWNADAGGHVGLCRAFARLGITAMRLSLPYHDARRPPELARADYIVSANIGRTAQANRQAVLDARRTIDWLVRQGYERIGVMGTSLGSCLAMLTMAHDTRVQAGAFNHVSPFFADVVWRGLSTQHVRAGFDGHITLDELRQWWMPISPWPFLDRVRGRRMLLVYARYDLTFPVDLSRQLLQELARRNVQHHVAVLPCGHYTTGRIPFKFLDGFYLAKFLARNL